MIQDIAPHRFDNAFGHRRAPADTDQVVCAKGSQVLLREGEELSFPTVREICGQMPEARERLVYLFLIDETAYYFLPPLRTEPGGTPGPDWMDFFPGFRLAAAAGSFRDAEPPWLGYAGITACQLARWWEEHRFCGRCGAPLRPSEEERAFCCDACGAVVYPKISPAVIVAVTDGDRLLMSRYAGRPFRRYALLAGFTEIGETVEDTVHREVMEEVGLKVKNLRYFASQPWAFSDSLLMGFFADLDGSPEIRLDETELAEAVWFPREQVPEQKSLQSLTSTMVEAFRQNRYPR